MTPYAIAYSGFPGAGKTEAATYATRLVGGTHVSMGEIVKELVRDELGPDATSHEIGEWATQNRQFGGQAVMAEKIVGKWLRTELPEEPVHIEGVRSVAELQEFRRMFGHIPVIFVQAPIMVRLERLQERGRDGEADFNLADLLYRDQREAEWGLQQLENESDYLVQNDGTLDELHYRIRGYLTGPLAFREHF